MENITLIKELNPAQIGSPNDLVNIVQNGETVSEGELFNINYIIMLLNGRLLSIPASANDVKNMLLSGEL